MIIEDIQPQDALLNAKLKVYRFVKQVTENFMGTSIGPVRLLLIYIVFTLPYISILIKQFPHFPEPFKTIIQSFALSSMQTNFGLSWKIYDVIIIVWSVTIVLLAASHFLFETVFVSFSYSLFVMLKLTNLLLLPLVDFIVTSFQFAASGADVNRLNVVMNMFASIVVSIAIGIMLFMQFFEIRFLRKKSDFWNLSNDIHFYGISFQIFKTLAISNGSSLQSWCLASVIVWYYHRQSKFCCVGDTQSAAEFVFYDLIVATDLAVLSYFVFNDSWTCFSIWVILIVLAFSRSLLMIYQESRSCLYVPTCQSSPQKFYDFYYRFKETFKGDEQSWQEKTSGKQSRIYHLHRLHCEPQQCTIDQHFGTDSEKPLETVISEIIAKKQGKNIQNRMVAELWNLELGKKVAVTALMQKPELSTSQDYLLFCIEQLSKDSEVSLQTSESNKEVISKAFYDLMLELASHFSQLYDQLSRSHPVTDSLVSHGIAIKSKVQKLKEVYYELLKLKLISFKMVEIYIEFITKFVGKAAIDKDDANRLVKLQQDIVSEDISENPSPAFTFYLETGALENVNAEGQKFLQSTRFQLKNRNIADLTEPSLSAERLKNLAESGIVNHSDEPFFSFFHCNENDFTCGSFSASGEQTVKKNLFVLEVQIEPFSSLKNYFLIDSEFQMELSLRKEVKVKMGCHRSNPLKLSWRYLFDKYVAPNQTKITKNKMLKVTTEFRECSLVIKQRRCAVQGYICLQVQVFMTAEESQERQHRHSVISFRNPNNSGQKQFQFHYGESEQTKKAILYGMKPNSQSVKRLIKDKTLTQFEKSLNANLVSCIIENEKNYGEDIRTYRLYEGELYNVDLEDREAYNDMFELHLPAEHKNEIDLANNYDNYVLIAVVLLGCALVGLSIYAVVAFNGTLADTSQYTTRHLNMHSLVLELSRVMAILKDKASGFADKFANYKVQAQIENSYGRIQKLKENRIFDSQTYQIAFQGQIYEGILTELMDLLLAHVTEVFGNGNLATTEDIHTGYSQLSRFINIEKDVLHGHLATNFQKMRTVRNIVVFVSVGLVLCLFGFMFCFCYLVNTKVKSSLEPLLFFPDSETNAHRENADKIKYAVEMVRKNFEIDPQSLLLPVPPGKRRKHPKEAVTSRQILCTILSLALFGLAIHIACLVAFTQTYADSEQLYTGMNDNAEALIRVYGGAVEASVGVSHEGVLDQALMTQLGHSIHYLAYSMNEMKFSAELNAEIHTLFFENSCSLLFSRYGLSPASCQSTAPEFTIANPFEMGLLYYFNRQKYFFYNNVTETFAHTSVYSPLFLRLYTDLTVRLNNELLGSLTLLSTNAGLLNYVIIVIDLAYMAVFVGLFLYLRTQIQRIRELVDFFRDKINARRETVREEQQPQKLEDEEQQPLLNAPPPPPKRVRRGTTLEQRLPEQF